MTLGPLCLRRRGRGDRHQPLDPGVKARVLNANAGLTRLDDARANLRRAGV